MEQISFPCPSCHRTLKAPADKAGRKARCKCGAQVVIPAAQPEALSTIPLVDDAGPAAPAARAGGLPPLQPAHDEEALLPPEPATRPRLTLDENEELLPPAPAAPPRLSLAEDEELLPPPPPPRERPADEAKTPAMTSMEPTRPAAMDEDEDDEGTTYTLTEAFEAPTQEEAPKGKRAKDEEEEEEEDEEEKKEDEIVRRPKRPLGKIPVDQDQWRAVQKGSFLIAIGMGLWIGAFCLQRLFVFMGSQAPMEYAELADTILINPAQEVEAGKPRQLDRPDFVMGLIAGSSFLTLGEWIMRLAIVLAMAQTVVTAFGYLTLLGGPSQLGMKTLAMAGLAVAGTSFLLIFVFKLLPLTSLIRYVMIPFLAPEVAMLTANGDRIDPIHITWSDAAMVECFFALLFQMVLLAEPVLVAVYLRSAAQALKIQSLQETTEGLIRLGLGTAFIQLSYLLLMNAGTSPPLLLVLRAIYLLGTGFFLGLLIWLPVVLLRSRENIEKVLRVGWVA
jgi:hypothetical protein